MTGSALTAAERVLNDPAAVNAGLLIDWLFERVVEAATPAIARCAEQAPHPLPVRVGTEADEGLAAWVESTEDHVVDKLRESR